jgi:hypothetical protein
MTEEGPYFERHMEKLVKEKDEATKKNRHRNHKEGGLIMGKVKLVDLSQPYHMKEAKNE